MAWAFNPFTGNLDYYVVGAPADSSGGLDNLLLTDGSSFLTLTSGTEDVLLLT